MNPMDLTTFVFTHLSLVFCIVLFIVTLRGSHRSHIQSAFYAMIAVMFIWNVGTLLLMYYQLIFGVTSMVFVGICYFGICFTPIAILFMGRTIYQSYVAFKPAHALLLVVPCASMIIICTNAYHHLFFIDFSIHSSQAVYGVYYYFHSIYSYACILIGIIYMVSFSMKNSGIFSMQSSLVLLGILIPLSANVLYSFNLLDLTFYINSSMFTVALLCFTVAFYKYDFLKVAPIAVQNIVDLISDAYLVVDAQNNIVAYNKPLLYLLPDRKPIGQNSSLEVFLDQYCAPGAYTEFIKLQTQSDAEKCTISMEYKSLTEKYFTVEITPIYMKRALIGTIILLKDITQAKRDLEIIQETQAVMVERERLAFLGQLIGGITHNLKTPILSIAGGIEGLTDLTAEYEESIGDPGVTVADHLEIIEEMYDWIAKIKTHCAYISDMISTVKGQAVQFNRSDMDTFTIDEFLKRVDMLMKNELKRSYCILRTRVDVDVSSQLVGDVNTLVQIFDNLIMNSIYAYEGKPGYIDLAVVDDVDKFIFTITDYGKGIEPSVKERLFKEMVTTKGKNGTGLGLYLSHSTIKGHFNGKITVDSEVGQGAVFTITIPKRKIPKAFQTAAKEEAAGQDAQG